jgi:hypothetical protein
VKELLAAVAKKEGLTLPQPLADRIAAAAKRDMRRALLSLEVPSYFHASSAISLIGPVAIPNATACL